MAVVEFSIGNADPTPVTTSPSGDIPVLDGLANLLPAVLPLPVRRTLAALVLAYVAMRLIRSFNP